MSSGPTGADGTSLPVTRGLLRRWAAGWLVTLLAVAVVLASLVGAHALDLGDRILLHATQTLASPPLDVAMAAMSFLGGLELTVPAALALTLLARRSGRWFWVPLAVFLTLNLIELGGKNLVPQLPVPPALARGPRLGIVVSTAYSFPSGHMTRVTMLAGWAALAAWRRRPSQAWLWGCVALVWLMGFGRVYLGDHWPTDVAGGILLGGAGLALALLLAPEAVLMV